MSLYILIILEVIVILKMSRFIYEDFFNETEEKFRNLNIVSGKEPLKILEYYGYKEQQDDSTSIASQTDSIINSEEEKNPKEKIFNYESNLKKSTVFNDNEVGNFLFFFIPVKKSHSKLAIESIKNLIKNEISDKTLYYSRISNILDPYYLGLIRSIDFIENFCSFSFTCIQNDLKDWKNLNHSALCPLIIFSKDNDNLRNEEKKNSTERYKLQKLETSGESESTHKKPLINPQIEGFKKVFYDENSETVQKIDPVDFFLLTDESFDIKYYDMIHEKLTNDIETIFSSYIDIFEECFSSLKDKFNCREFERISNILITYQHIFLFDSRFKEIDCKKEAIKIFLDEERQNKSFFWDSENIVEKDINLSNDIIILEKFFDLIDKKSWETYINIIIDIGSDDNFSYIILTLKTDKYKHLSNMIDKLLSKINENEVCNSDNNFGDHGKRLFRYYFRNLKDLDNNCDVNSRNFSLTNLYLIEKDRKDDKFGLEFISNVIELENEFISSKKLEKLNHEKLTFHNNNSFYDAYISIMFEYFGILSFKEPIEVEKNSAHVFANSSLLRIVNRKIRSNIFNKKNDEYNSYKKINAWNFRFRRSFSETRNLHIYHIRKVIEYLTPMKLKIGSLSTNYVSYAFTHPSEYLNAIEKLNIEEIEFLILSNGPIFERDPTTFSDSPDDHVLITSRTEFHLELEINSTKLKCIYRTDLEICFYETQIMLFLFEKIKEKLFEISDESANMELVKQLIKIYVDLKFNLLNDIDTEILFWLIYRPKNIQNIEEKIVKFLIKSVIRGGIRNLKKNSSSQNDCVNNTGDINKIFQILIESIEMDEIKNEFVKKMNDRPMMNRRSEIYIEDCIVSQDAIRIEKILLCIG